MAIPDQCQRCYKYSRQTIDTNCPICRESSFPERLLCDLTREGQRDQEEFTCGAFRPNLAVVGKKTAAPPPSGKFESLHDIMLSTKIKWLLARAKQFRKPFKFDEDEVVYDLKYHICLAATYRKPIFAEAGRVFEDIEDLFRQSGDVFAHSVNLLGLAVDHVHLYIDARPDYSVEEVVQNIFAAMEPELIEMLPAAADAGVIIFNREYFVESLGEEYDEPDVA